MATKFLCDVCGCDKRLQEFYQHEQKYIKYDSTTDNIFSMSTNNIKHEPIMFDNDDWSIQIVINNKNHRIGMKPKDICNMCAIGIVQKLFVEKVIDRL